jgi:hypothetical protein
LIQTALRSTQLARAYRANGAIGKNKKRIGYLRSKRKKVMSACTNSLDIRGKRLWIVSTTGMPAYAVATYADLAVIV